MIGTLEHWRFVRVPVKRGPEFVITAEVLVPGTRLTQAELNEAVRITSWLGALEAAVGLR